MLLTGITKSTAAPLLPNGVIHSMVQKTPDLQPHKEVVHSAACIVICVGVTISPHFEATNQVDYLNLLLPARSTLRLDGRTPPPAKQPPKFSLII